MRCARQADNISRLHEALDYQSPAEVEAGYHMTQAQALSPILRIGTTLRARQNTFYPMMPFRLFGVGDFIDRYAWVEQDNLDHQAPLCVSRRLRWQARTAPAVAKAELCGVAWTFSNVVFNKTLG